MDNKYYSKVRREGLRAYTAAIQKNQDPYLPVLEERQPLLNQLDRLPLGIQSVPIDRIAGSVSRGRSYAFANNFMPILESNSEFAAKWETLYESVMEQGMRDPAKMLEYMGYYYLIEGNKRVSVMKSLGAEYVEADVSRVLPPRSDDPTYAVYLEYCAFSRESGIYDLYLTHSGAYKQLSSLPGMKEGDAWTDDDRLSLKKIWHYFYTAYNKIMKGKKAQEPSDAFLLMLVAFSYNEVRDESMEKVEQRIRLMQEEFLIHDETVSIVMDQEKNPPQPPLIASLFRPSKIKAAFLYTRSIEDSAWNYWHDKGRMEVQESLGSKVETVSCIVPSRASAEEEIDRLIREGFTAIFATSPVMLNTCIEPSLKHPDVKLLVCSQLAGYQHIRTYYLRFFEVKFLLGMVAGMLSRNGKIGYIADYPIYGSPSMINAFAIGARMVNPDARIYLNWTSLLSYDPQEPFHDPEIRVICNRDLTAPDRLSEESGLYVRSEGQILSSAALIPHWGVFYRYAIDQIQKGTFDAAVSGKAPMNYWWGLASDVLDISFSPHFPAVNARLIRNFQDQIRDQGFTPFEGELRDQSGAVRCEADRRLTPAEILCMDYLADNVAGTLPSEEEMAPAARALVHSQGISGPQKADVNAISWNKG